MDAVWCVDEDGLALADEAGRATVFSVGNGATCTRGTPAHAAEYVSQGVFVAGAFTRAPRGYSYFMDAPDWLPVWLAQDGARLTPRAFQRRLDLRAGVLHSRSEYRIGGRAVIVEETRFASFAAPWVVAQRVVLRAPRGTPAFELGLGIAGRVRSDAAKYFKDLRTPTCDGVSVSLTRVEMALATPAGLSVGLIARDGATRARASLTVRQSVGPRLPASHTVAQDLAATVLTVPAGGGAWTFDKLGVVTADIPGRHDCRVDHIPVWRAARRLTFGLAYAAHTAAVRDFWAHADVTVSGDPAAQRAVRFALWSTRIAAPDDGGATSIGARNLNGDMYRGMVFWDVDVFQFPMLAAAAPRQALNHLLNRARCLPRARRRAARDGYAGAAYPFTTAGLDYEQLENDFCFLEVHINLAIAWAILHYDTLAGDRAFFARHGLAVLVELARFWVTRAAWDAAGAAHLRQVCGPDEFRRKGCDDNAYTNSMTAWALRLTAARAEQAAPALRRKLGVTAAEATDWRRLADALHVPFDAARGLIEQSADYFALPEPDFKLNQGRWGMVDRTSKQADVLLLWQQGIPVPHDDPGLLARCWREYAPICHHLSSLSNCTHALAAIRLRRLNDATHFFRRTLAVDLAHGNAQGTHGAGEGGLWLAVVHGYGGLRVQPGRGVAFDPLLPPGWTRLAYRTRIAGTWCAVDVRARRFSVANQGDQPVTFEVDGAVRRLAPGARRTFPIRARWLDEGIEGVILPIEGCLDVLIAAPDSAAARRLRRRLERWRAAGVAIGVVSARVSVARFLRRAGLAAWVTDWADASRIHQAPPAPDLYEVVCMRLRRLPWNCRAIGAAGTLAAAARAAGVPAGKH